MWLTFSSACRRRYRSVFLGPGARVGRAWGSVQPTMERAFGGWLPVTSALLRTLSLAGSPASDRAFRQRHPSQRGLHSPGVGPWLRPEPWAGECQQGTERTTEWGGRLPPAACFSLVRFVSKHPFLCCFLALLTLLSPDVESSFHSLSQVAQIF